MRAQPRLSGDGGIAATGRRDAETLMAGIRRGMTFGQIGKAVPHVSMTDLGVYEHGGDWYDIAINEDYTIQIRVAHHPEGTTAANSVINFSPRLRNRKTQEFLAGQEEPW